MTSDEIKEYLTNLLVVSGSPTVNISDYLENVIKIGLTDFWNADTWAFRLRVKTLTISSSTTEYDLPTDFGMLSDIREKTSILGKQLIPMSKESFDKEFPRLDAFTEGTPKAFTIYYSDQKPKIKFFPMPTAMTLYVDYYSSTPIDVQRVPDDMVGGLLAAVERYLHPVGSPARLAAMTYYSEELKRMRRKGGFLGNLPTYMPDMTDVQMGRHIPWVG
jgi:hypothetical protein